MILACDNCKETYSYPVEEVVANKVRCLSCGKMVHLEVVTMDETDVKYIEKVVTKLTEESDGQG